MKTKPPPDRRTFASEWDEITYLYHKLLYWLYSREDARKARPCADRLQELLPKTGPNHEGIFGEACWSLVNETKGDLGKAIKFRENAIRLIRRLHALVRKHPAQAAIALKNYGCEDWSDRLDLFAILYHDAGDLDRALAILRQSNRLCERHGVRFDGEDLVEQYSAEKRKLTQAKRPKSRAAS